MSVDPHMRSELDPNALTVEQALARIEQSVRPVEGTERLALRSALGRVCAADIHAPFDVPSHANSAMDGYAVNSRDLPQEGHRELRLVGQSLAGHPWAGELGPGECLRITTGAVIPAGADTVIMQEAVHKTAEGIRIGAGHRPGENVRLPGEDLRAGALVLRRGRRLNSADLGLLASLGISELDVIRRPVVAFFSTGDELKGLGQPLAEGEIYDSNRYTLHAMLQRLNVQIVDMGVVQDQPQAVEEAFRTAAARADVVITTGGVSVGTADYIKHTLEKLGHVGFWRIAMKPGRPLAFGQLGNALFFGLPGNPVSVMATFTLFARIAIQRLSGETPQPMLRLRAVTQNRLRKLPGRTDYQRGILRQDDQGRLVVETTGLQGSHVLSSMSRANCFIVIPRDCGDVEAGTEVEVIPFEGLL